MSEPTYRIVRFYQNRGEPKEIVATGLSYEQAKRHCNDPETSSTTCTNPAGRDRTKYRGQWFDGFERE